MPTQQDFEEFLMLGREDRFIEYKQSAPWHALKNKIAKTAMAMANLPDGGRIIIGLERTEMGTYEASGMQDQDATTFNADEIQAYINKYADPYVTVEVYHRQFKSRMFIEVRVREFDVVPIVCRADGESMRAGALYVRSSRMPETSEVRSQTDMRELLDLAINKGVRMFLARLTSVGVSAEAVAGITHKERFVKQRVGL